MKSQQSWDNFYMSLVDKISELSYAEDKKVGALVVKDDNIVSFSYNGTARGRNNSTEANGRTLDEVYHAEASALHKLAKSGVSPYGATIYCTMAPCIHCAKIIYGCGLSRVVYKTPYKDMSGVDFLLSLGVAVNTENNHAYLIPRDQLKNTGLLNGLSINSSNRVIDCDRPLQHLPFKCGVIT